MHRILFQFGEFTIYSYGFMIALALLICTIWLYIDSSRQGYNPEHILEVVVIAALSGLLGARLLYVAQHWSYYSSRWLEIFFTRYEGLSYLGALFGGTLAVFLWCRWRKISFLKLADLMAPYMALGYAIGRVGCFLNGCCYGKVSSVAWALPAAMVDNQLSHPVQLYAAVGALIIFVILKLIRPVRPFVGFTTISLFALYGVLRFITEFFRYSPTTYWGGLTLAQLFCLGMVVVTVAIIGVVLLSGAGKAKKGMPQ